MKKKYKINKVNIDLSNYNGNDSYSDGDIEAEILNTLKLGKGKELLFNDNRWPVLYHLSSKRYNLLDGFSFKENASVLEIGCGCGAVTGILCHKAKSVTAVEISPRRAEIAAYQNKNRDNLTICVGNLNDMNFKEKFDYVTLIGVLEYAGSFTHTDNPWLDFLFSCKKFLKSDGKIIIAIENKLGMKYWSGAREDHTGGYFDGMEGYDTNAVKTFSRKELKELLLSAGFMDIEWFYPHPDYKFPIDIYSDNHLPTVSQLKEVANWPYDHNRVEIFSENKAFFNILNAGLYPEFSNSFLVIASSDNVMNKLKQPSYIHHPFMRKDKYSVVTSIVDLGNKMVIRKEAINYAGKKHLKMIAENCQILNKIYGIEHVAQCRMLNDKILEMDYIEGQSFSDLAIKAMYEGGVAGLSGYIEFYCNNILIGIKDGMKVPDFDFTSPKRQYNFDLHFGNIIVNESGFAIFDYEWLASNIPAKYTLYRTLKILYLDNISDMKKFNVDLDLLFKSCGIDKNDEIIYKKWDIKFGSMVQDNYMLNYRKDIRKIDLNELNVR